MKTIIAAVLAIALLTGCARTAYVERDPNVDFSKIRTYAWLAPDAKKSKSAVKAGKDLEAERIRLSIDRNLQANGWKEVKHNPDVLLLYDVDVQKADKPVTDPVYSYPVTRWFYSPWRRTYIPVYYPSQFIGYRSGTQRVQEGTLTLTVMNAADEKTIWQGWTTSELDGRRMTDKEIDANVKAIIKKLV
jgi:hypothetical protein